MKRFFFSLIALSAVAIGCTQSALLETPDQFGTEITFSPYTGRTPVTKAASVENEAGLATAGGFHIVGLLTNSVGTSVYMDGQVQGTSTTSGTTTATTWAYGVTSSNGTWQETKMYWPDATSSSTLSFVAYSQNAVGRLDWSDTEGEENTTFTYTVPTDVTNQIDLLVAPYQSGLNLENNSDGKVDLTFHHMLSRIGFKVQASHNISGRNITIESLTFTGHMPVAGTIDVTDYTVTSANTSPAPVLTPVDGYLASDPASYSFLKQDFVTPSSTGVVQIKRNGANDTSSDQYMMIMPHAVSDDKIIVEYLVGDDEKTATVNLPTDLTFIPGRAYDFILKVSTSKISFEVAETDWNTTHDDISVNVKVKSTSAADIILTATEKQTVLGSLGVEYRPMPADPAAEWTGSVGTAAYSGTYPYYQSGTIALTGLTEYTEYQYRVYSEKNSKKTYYPVGTFKTLVNISIDVRLDESDIKSDALTVIGSYTTNKAVSVDGSGFYLVKGKSTPDQYDETVSASSDFKATFDGLEPATEYTCRAYVIIDGVTYLSTVDYTKHTFTTAPVFVFVDPDNDDPDNDDPDNDDPDNDDPSGDEGGDNQGPPAASFEEEEGEDNDGDGTPDNEIII